jgi:carbamate kinase
MNIPTGSTIVIALGGNALLKRGEAATSAVQRTNISRAAASIAPLLKKHQIIITHGNGPQVGLLAQQSGMSGWPLDVLGAESEGMIGYVIEQELANRCREALFATLLTQVVVDQSDRAFQNPTKPIGLVYQDRATLTERGWASIVDGTGWRRVVASPQPRRILGLNTIRLLVEANVTVICLGGGGIPVAVDQSGKAHGIEAVIDKDAASCLLAQKIDADALIMLTDVAGVMDNFGASNASLIKHATPCQLAECTFPAGSMGPKVEAAISMANAGKVAIIGALNDLDAILAGKAGTWIVPDAVQNILA